MPKKTNHFKQYYDLLNEADKKKLREKIICDLELSMSNFWWKLRNEKWKTLEKNIIAKAAKQPIGDLFPELQPA